MNREQLRGEARAAALRAAPELGAAAVEAIIESPAMQHWFDSIERRRPRGIVAFVRRLRGGKQRGLTSGQRAELEEYIRLMAEQA